MFYRADLDAILAENGATGSFSDVIGYGINDGLSIQIDALDFISMVLGGGVEGHREVETGVETFTAQREALFKCLLFQHIFLFNRLLGCLLELGLEFIHLLTQAVQLEVHIGKFAEDRLRLEVGLQLHGGRTNQAAASF